MSFETSHISVQTQVILQPCKYIFLHFPCLLELFLDYKKVDEVHKDLRSCDEMFFSHSNKTDYNSLNPEVKHSSILFL